MNAERDRFIKEKLDQGVSLSEVQRLLDSELGIRMTYLDLRLLAADLEVNWEKQAKDKSEDEMDISKIPPPRTPSPQPRSPSASSRAPAWP
jgi:DNA-binding transcriptional MerR regulator